MNRCQHGAVNQYCPHCDGWQDSPNNTETDGNQPATQSSGHNRGSEALKNSSSLCSSCPALAAEIAHGHLCDAQAERITALEAEIERLSKDKDAI